MKSGSSVKASVHGKAVSVPKFCSSEGTCRRFSILYPLVLFQIEILSRACVCVCGGANAVDQTEEHPEMARSLAW